MTAGAHWSAAIAPLLTALRPAAVGAAGVEGDVLAALEAHRASAGYELVGAEDPRAAALVLGGEAPVDSGPARDLVVVIGAAAAQRLTVLSGGRPRHVEGFGGLDAWASDAALTANPDFAAAWANVGASDHLAAVGRELECERERLERAAAEQRGREAERIAQLELALDRLEAVERSRQPLVEAVETASALIEMHALRIQSLEQRSASVVARAAAAEERLAEERAWMIGHAQAVADSLSWRLGHRLVRLLRQATLRRDYGTDGLEAIVRGLGDGTGAVPPLR